MVPDGPRTSVLITGAAGYVGRLVTEALAKKATGRRQSTRSWIGEPLARDRGPLTTIVATDVRTLPSRELPDGVIFEQLDITDGDRLRALLEAHAIDTVVHLAAVVTPRPGDSREMQYAVDVEGTANVLAACVDAGVKKLVYTSSGAAYGYHADSPPLLREDDPLRGNETFAYAWHKRLVEEQLAVCRAEHPELEQLVFRVSTVLGPSVHNQITAMFERPVVLGLREADTPFCFIWDRDVVDALCGGVFGDATGTYNLTADGVMTLREIATAMGRRYVALPARVVETGLALLARAELSPYGPEQVAFLRYRPVLDNDKLVRELGFVPQKTTREVFELYRSSRA